MSETGGSSFRPRELRPPVTPQAPDQKLRDASKMYEKLFLGEMLKAMRSTVNEGGLIKQNSAEKLFREEMDKEHINNWSDRGGVGFADIIYDNLMQKYGAQMGLRAPDQRPSGPLPINAKSNFQGMTRVPSRNDKEMTLRFDREFGDTTSKAGANPKGADGAAAGAPALQEMTAPWSGILTGKKDLGEGVHLLEIEHENGLKGQLTFRGTPERLNPGQSLQAGEKIGLLSPEARSFFWTLAPAGQAVSE